MLGLGPGCGPKPKPKINSEFNSIHFGIEINKCLKFLTPKNFLVLKFLTFLKILKKIFSSNFLISYFLILKRQI